MLFRAAHGLRQSNRRIDVGQCEAATAPSFVHEDSLISAVSSLNGRESFIDDVPNASMAGSSSRGVPSGNEPEQPCHRCLSAQ